MEKIKVLYIDDEIANLNSFKASFRRSFDIYTAISAEEGMKILSEVPIEVLLSDQRMPGKTGVDFFESILDIYPNPIRILVTAYVDKDAIIDSINKGRVYQFVTKPWNDIDLKLTIQNAYQLYLLKEQNKNINLKYKRIFSESSDPIIIFDTKGFIIDYNKVAIELLDHVNDKNNYLFDSIIADKIDAEQILKTIEEDGGIKDFECEIISKNDEKRICLLSVNSITNNYGEIINYQALIKDITERSRSNQLLLKKIIETQEFERERISKELHDGIGQSLAAIHFNLESLKDNYLSKNDISKELYSLPKLVNETIQDLRRICFNTLPLVLQTYGLINAIEVIRLNLSTADFNIKFNCDEDYIELSNTLEISIFRIIQEFINNSVKHSNATEVVIDLSCSEKNIILKLKDNGIGFNINDLVISKGYGLRNIKTRIESVQGQISMNSSDKTGTQFDIEIPVLVA